MDTTALVVIGLAVLVIVLVLMLARGGRRGNHADLVPLAGEARGRYLTEWDRIETRFVDAPEEAVREADSVVMSVLRERRHPLEERSLPKEIREARREGARGQGAS